MCIRCTPTLSAWAAFLTYMYPCTHILLYKTHPFFEMKFQDLETVCVTLAVDSDDIYLGCFMDEFHDRDLTHYVEETEWWLPNLCVSRCHQLGYIYAGVQDGDECWCGNTYGGKAIQTLPVADSVRGWVEGWLNKKCKCKFSGWCGLPKWGFACLCNGSPCRELADLDWETAKISTMGRGALTLVSISLWIRQWVYLV